MKVATTSLITLALAAEAMFGASASSLQDAPMNHRGLVKKLKRVVGLPAQSGFVGDVHISNLQKRDYHGTGTYYGAGVSAGACGSYSNPADNVVALNIGLYGNPNAQSSWCGRQLTITAGGVTETATVVDCCPTCPGNGDLDMSKALFQKFASLNQGVVSISWNTGGGSSSSSGSGSSHSSNHNSNNDNNNNNNDKTTTHHTVAPAAKTTSEQKQTTVYSTKTSSSSSTSATPTATSTTTSADASSSTSTTPGPDATGSGEVSNLAGMSQVLQGMFNMANAVQTT